MQCFVLDIDPVTSANYLADIHLLSQPKEILQVISTAIYLRKPDLYRSNDFEFLYYPSHVRHPLVRFVASQLNEEETLFPRGSFATWMWYNAARCVELVESRTQYKTTGVMEDMLNSLVSPKSGKAAIHRDMTDWNISGHPALSYPKYGFGFRNLPFIKTKMHEIVVRYRMYYLLKKKDIIEWRDDSEPLWAFKGLSQLCRTGILLPETVS